MTQRISINPDVHCGKPCVSGTRIPVTDVLELVRAGHDFGKIREDFYPDLTNEDIQACVDYAISIIRCEDVHTAGGR